MDEGELSVELAQDESEGRTTATWEHEELAQVTLLIPWAFGFLVS